jgi:hypothetical protein
MTSGTPSLMQVPELVHISTDSFGNDHDNDDNDDEETERAQGTLQQLQLPSIEDSSIEHDFSLCDACYTTSKKHSYLHIGGKLWEYLLFKNYGHISLHGSCCVLGAIICHSRIKPRTILNATEGDIVSSTSQAARSFGSKMSDILLLTDRPILREIESALRVEWEDVRVNEEDVRVMPLPEHGEFSWALPIKVS